MKSKIPLFFLVLTLLYCYTLFKASEFLPSKKYLSIALGTLVFLLIVGVQVLYRLYPPAYEREWFQYLSWAGVFTLGLWATFILFMLPLDIGRLGLAFLEKVGHIQAQVNPGRRSFFVRCLSWGVFGLSGGIAGLGLLEVSQGPQVKEVQVPIDHLPPEFLTLKIVQISDLHIGPTIRRGYVEQVVKKIMQLKPDLIAITGDQADGTPILLDNELKPFSQLSAPLGVYYVTGNHEYYWGAEAWIKKMEDLGMIPLVNENRVVRYSGKKVLVAGVTDSLAHQFVPAHLSSPIKAAKSQEQCDLKILLAHRPDSCFEAETAGFDLQLSGHTHGGQFFPWNLLVRMAHQYYKGLNRYGKMWVYVNSGTGYWGPPHRFAVPSEITLVHFSDSLARRRSVQI
jgi:predicted MPP superfamily phosphohydrolase